MQVIYIKTLKNVALIIMFFLVPSTSLRVNSKRNKKTPGCRTHPSPLLRYYPELVEGRDEVFYLLIFARLRSAKIYAKRKKWNLKSKKLGRIFYFTRAWHRTNAVPIRVNAFFRAARWNG